MAKFKVGDRIKNCPGMPKVIFAIRKPKISELRKPPHHPAIAMYMKNMICYHYKYIGGKELVSCAPVQCVDKDHIYAHEKGYWGKDLIPSE